MLPFNFGGHAAYQDTFVSDFLKFYSDPFSLSKSSWDYIVQFWYLDLSRFLIPHVEKEYNISGRIHSIEISRSYRLSLTCFIIILDFLHVNLIDILGISTTFLAIPTFIFIGIINIVHSVHPLANIAIDILGDRSENKINIDRKHYNFCRHSKTNVKRMNKSEKRVDFGTHLYKGS